jgi:hypothetical protein
MRTAPRKRRPFHPCIGAVVGTALVATGWAPHGVWAAIPVAIAPAPALTRVEAPSSAHHPPIATYVVVGLAGVGAALGTAFGIRALHEKRSFDDGDKTTGRVEAIEKDALFSDMAFGAALTLGITAIVLWCTPADGGASPGSEVAAVQDEGPGQRGASPEGSARRRRGFPAVTVAPLWSSSGQGASALFHF